MGGFWGAVITSRQFILNNERRTATIQSQVTEASQSMLPDEKFKMTLEIRHNLIKMHNMTNRKLRQIKYQILTNQFGLST